MSVKALIPLATLATLAKAEVTHDKATANLAVNRGKVVAEYMLAGVKRADALTDAGTRSTVNVDSLGVTWSQIGRALDVAMVVVAGDDTTAHVLTLNMVAAGTVRGLATFAEDGSLILPKGLNWQVIAASCPKVSTKGRKAKATEPTEPAEPADGTEPAEPADGTEPTEPADGTEPTEPADGTEPVTVDSLTRALENITAKLAAVMARPGATLTRTEQVRIITARDSIREAIAHHNAHTPARA